MSIDEASNGDDDDHKPSPEDDCDGATKSPRKRVKFDDHFFSFDEDFKYQFMVFATITLLNDQYRPYLCENLKIFDMLLTLSSTLETLMVTTTTVSQATSQFKLFSTSKDGIMTECPAFRLSPTKT
jgi:hypothetical protein